MNRKLSVYRKLILVLTALILLGAGLSFIPAFCDWWGDHVQPVLEGGIGRVTAHLPFILGEWTIGISILLGLLCLVFLILLLFLRKKQGYRRFARGWYKSVLMIFAVVSAAYVLIWFIPFRGTVLGQGRTDRRTDFGFEELHRLCSYAVEGVNAAAEEIPVAEDGTVSFPTVEENHPKIAAAMQAFSSECKRLTGFYPPVKTAFFSDLLDHLRIGGVTIPLTGEAMHNKYSLQPHYQPVLDAHELSHFKGYYNESDANFIAEVALSRSEDPYLRFSAFMDMLNYLNQDYENAVSELETQWEQEGKLPPLPENPDIKNPEHKALIKERAKQVGALLPPSPSYTERTVRILNASWSRGQEVYDADSHPLDEMPTVSEVVSDVADVGWSTQAAVLKEHCYDGVTLLLLQYYDGKL
ncbi:MAG: DUF3810 family protein [Oscillospiraceae bacterium]|nr:DUF3810 family protein [Oscillospiraceae bacterium]